MATPAAAPPPDISFKCTNMDELFTCFVKITSGSPLPNNVIDHVNPYGIDPKNLPEGVWFLINSKEEVDTEGGEWKTKEEGREVFSDSEMIGWRTSLEYYEGREPRQRKTEWVMEMFNVTVKRMCDEKEKHVLDRNWKETSSLCRVSLVPSHEMVENGTGNHLIPHLDLDAHSSSRNPQHEETEALAVAERNEGENLFGTDSGGYDIGFFAGGNFLELKDLDNPASPSSSSDNSSAISISSGECFDSLAILQELDEQILEQKDSGKKLDVLAGDKPNELDMVPATLGCLVSVEGSNSSSEDDESFKTGASGDPNNQVAKRAKVEEGPSSSRKPSESHGGRRKGGSLGGMLRKKYFCFMPF
ncbi:NAC domain-containing protein 22 isoform X1 [Gossypium raimondii]|uniref:NAC domain-containing protein 22 isoform X1 n=1 Tax=Gossypium raimondii TaxID=29730 RepID=UPI00227AE309|nr:NAC domain-containing protein 22 isoform X1 [Gossypium raimondii]XP_052487612.1 NAC domain-containing protein 22 isoform X1 [Gossypium raimondii]